MKNYYQFLGLDRSASSSDIKKAYRDYAKRFHPDKHGDDVFFKERFQEIEAAYHTLSDHYRRSEYDKTFFNEEAKKKSPVREDHETTNNQKESSYSDNSSYSQENSNHKQGSHNSQTNSYQAHQKTSSSAETEKSTQGHWSDIWGYPLFFGIGALTTGMVIHTIGDLGLQNLFSDESSYNSFQIGSIIIGGIALMIWYHFND